VAEAYRRCRIKSTESKKLMSWWWFLAFAIPFTFIVASLTPPYPAPGWLQVASTPAALLAAVLWFIAYRRWP